MKIAPDRRAFIAEFESLKAKYGKEFESLMVARFKGKEQAELRDWEDFVPYWCREDDEGFIECEDERPI